MGTVLGSGGLQLYRQCVTNYVSWAYFLFLYFIANEAEKQIETLERHLRGNGKGKRAESREREQEQEQERDVDKKRER